MVLLNFRRFEFDGNVELQICKCGEKNCTGFIGTHVLSSQLKRKATDQSSAGGKRMAIEVDAQSLITDILREYVL